MDDIFLLGELFEQVQLQNVFPDGKTFVDCTPQSDLSLIAEKYGAQKNSPNFNLAAFVMEHFSLPETLSTKYLSIQGRPIEEHINLLWNELTRKPEEGKGSLISLPFPYIVPGGRFREIFYWDSYFTMLGLKISGRIDLIQNMIDNFSYLIEKFGYIPNGNRTYFLGRSQPPFYAAMVNLLAEEKGNSMLVDYLPQLEKEYNFWMKGTDLLTGEKISGYRVSLLPDGSILNHYWDENDTPRPESYKEDVELAEHVIDKKSLFRNLRAACESGWDFSSRWYKQENDFASIHSIEIIPVDLNCLLYNLEQTIAEAYLLSANITVSEKYTLAANNRKRAIEKYCWNKDERFYFDYDYVAEEQKKSATLAAVFPLHFKIATDEQAAGVAAYIKHHFLCTAGLQTTIVNTGQQWDSPNGWAPLHWMAIKGLGNYGHDALAKDVAARWLGINEKVYANTGKMMEKYNVVNVDLEAGGGEYQSQDGFGWTNGIYLALKKFIN